VLRIAGLVVTAAVMLGASFVGALAARLQSNLHTVDITALVGPGPVPSSSTGASQEPGDPSAGRAMNVLVLGSDQRNNAADEAIGGADASFASDTAIVMHLAADRSRVELVSIPRDSLVDTPACQGSHGATSKPKHLHMFNEAFATGWGLGNDMASAMACTWKTVQANTGVTIDHAVVVDFAGFQAMVTAIGGVDICIPRELDDPDYTGLHLLPGRQTLTGTQALQLARARHGNIGHGGDLARLGNQQRLLAAVANQVLSAGVLANPAKLTAFLSSATSSLTVDSGLNLVGMTGLAYGLQSVRADDITFTTIPTAEWAQNRNRLVWTPQAADVWANMAADLPIVRADGTLSAAPRSASAVPATSPSGGSSMPGSSGAAGSASPDASAPASPAPAPARTRRAGDEPFTAADSTAVCA
jgi:LCP family protein required for cell wall assembly